MTRKKMGGSTAFVLRTMQLREELEQGVELSAASRGWLIGVLDGKDPKAVFEYKTRKPRTVQSNPYVHKPTTAYNRDLDLALRVLVRRKVRRMNYVDAINDVALPDRGLSEPVVKKAYDKHRRSAVAILTHICDHPDFQNVVKKYLGES
ncbi:MAG: hypothetical protein OEQ39_16435 [Gammaproteobacteria bacterium]|nr:hypothetical protein [Gammaproteobacteria bacterium]MDH3466863.1 hypothetical protein [Gammaproteobacteria bacterium]